MTGDPVILSPKIPSCGCLTQPRRRAGPAVASSWPSVSQEGMDGGRQGRTRIHIVRPQSQRHTHSQSDSRQTQGTQSDGGQTWT